MEKVFVVDGSGRVATALIRDLVDANIEVVAGARHPEKVMKDPHVTAVALDLHDSTTTIANQMMVQMLFTLWPVLVDMTYYKRTQWGC